MKKPAPQAVHLKDYQASPYLIDTIDLSFDIFESHTLVRSRMQLHPNPKNLVSGAPLELNGEQLELKEVVLNGKKLEAAAFEVTESALKIFSVPAAAFSLEILVQIYPEKNTALEGLYKSSGIYCTQCEAEGFRRITYFLDRPDVMAKYSVEITAPKAGYPMLLSNGNLVEAKDLDQGRHYARWTDPFRKPCYLFALVAGNLGKVEDFFVTASGRRVTLQIFVNKGNENRCNHAMESLKKSMAWDERRFGLEYDLDIFMIVAVDDFNAGAMENKGLNIFNASYVLADAASATDDDYNGIEGVVAHEYFHNWTGNRVTCRDWFQLSLKEGLTVYRDQEFTSDVTSRAVKRIDDVMQLRMAQFPEDAGPMAHPIRPETYIEINNFYTATVYEKGAEVIGMIATLIGPQNFRKGMDKYFELYDGQAVTTEDFVRSMELASGADLTQFREWYRQAGTPRVKVDLQHSGDKCVLTVSQSTPPTPGQAEKKPLHIPFAMALLDRNGKELVNQVLSLKKPVEEFIFTGIEERPFPSLLRNFSAPVYVEYNYSQGELLFLLASDRDPFARWEASQKLCLAAIDDLVKLQQSGKPMKIGPDLPKALGKVLSDASVDPAFRAQLLRLPSEDFVSQAYTPIPIDEIHQARDFLMKAIAVENEVLLHKLYREFHQADRKYEYEAHDCGRRALKNICLVYLCCLGKKEYFSLAREQVAKANNMTDEMGAMEALNDYESAEREQAIAAFYNKWRGDSLVINKWFRLQATSDASGGLQRVQKLMADPLFAMGNPNKVRHLIFCFGFFNRAQFHQRSGDAYKFYVDRVLEIDAKNPQLASSLLRVFNDWKRLDADRRPLLRKELERLLATPNLSPGVFEKVSKFLE